jgi:dTDP-4-amino-4,6-dideoxygalactose transaminase
MIGLIPAENWEYGLSDLFAGVISTISNIDKYKIINIDGVGNCIPTRSARSAICIALRAFNLPKGARIGVPLYCCPVVFKAIEAAGCKHCFIDIDFETCCMSVEDLARKRNNLDAVIAVHMFGNTCDMPSLLDLVQGKPIIEDCAQSLGSMINGRMTGTFGAAAAFSFRSGKYLSVGEGGALFSHQFTIKQKLNEAISLLPVLVLSDELKHLAETYIRTKLRTRPFYGLVGYPLWKFYNKTVDYSAKSPIVFTQSYLSDVATATKRLKSLNIAIQKQRQYADLFTRELGLSPHMYCKEMQGTFYNRYLYPIFFNSTAQRDQMIIHLHKRRIGTAKPYHDIAEVAAKHYGYKGDCPVSEQVADRVLVVPNYYNLKEQEVQHIVRCIKDGLDATT